MKDNSTDRARLKAPAIVTCERANFWDDEYPFGGNYRSGYNGTDSLNGVYQNKTSSDGIGDTPYIIDANNKHDYPLMLRGGTGDIN